MYCTEQIFSRDMPELGAEGTLLPIEPYVKFGRSFGNGVWKSFWLLGSWAVLLVDGCKFGACVSMCCLGNHAQKTTLILGLIFQT